MRFGGPDLMMPRRSTGEYCGYWAVAATNGVAVAESTPGFQPGGWVVLWMGNAFAIKPNHDFG